MEDTPEKLSSLVNKFATKELATDVAVAGSIDAMNQRANLLKTQKNAISTLMKQLATQNSTTSKGIGRYRIAAYRSKLSA